MESEDLECTKPQVGNIVEKNNTERIYKKTFHNTISYTLISFYDRTK